jgi:hypothetical protein
MPQKDRHVTVDSYGIHKHPRVIGWLGRHPRFHVHFTPTAPPAQYDRVLPPDLGRNRIRRSTFAT